MSEREAIEVLNRQNVEARQRCAAPFDLEHFVEAKGLLRELADGVPDNMLTREAAATLKRLVR